MSASWTNLNHVILEYESAKGVPCPETHSYIRLKNRLNDRILAFKTVNMDSTYKDTDEERPPPVFVLTEVKMAAFDPDLTRNQGPYLG